MKRKIAIIGAGFSGISAAAYLAKDGNEVHVFEKNTSPGGRARKFITENGFTFDMGPSWYWMPDIIENFFNDFSLNVSDYFELIRLNPQFEMVFQNENINIPDSYEDLKNLFESMEKGAGKQLDKFMKSAKFKYETGMKEFAVKPCHSWMEFASPGIASAAIKLDLLSNFRSYVSKYFRNPNLRALMEFPVIFLGASPKEIPAMYSLMNYGGYLLGTHYPKGGFYELVKAMVSAAKKQGAEFHMNCEVEKIITSEKGIVGLTVNGLNIPFDAVIASSDYHHSETLLEKSDRNYGEEYWESRVFAPSCLIYYLGFKRKIPDMQHHTLFFENDLDSHIDSIYGNKRWPENPLFYACCPTKTDATVAPEGCENLFLLMPLATQIDDGEETREIYFKEMIRRIEKHSGTEKLENDLIYKKSYCVSDFKKDYNAYAGNAYGLANTLKQTAVLKPSIKNRQVQNLYYTGQLTVPGPGVPPSIISGKIVANEIKNKFNSQLRKQKKVIGFEKIKI